jgi:hypothetical protein
MVRLVDIVGIVDHHCLNFLFIIREQKKLLKTMIDESTIYNIENTKNTTI